MSDDEDRRNYSDEEGEDVGFDDSDRDDDDSEEEEDDEEEIKRVRHRGTQHGSLVSKAWRANGTSLLTSHLHLLRFLIYYWLRFATASLSTMTKTRKTRRTKRLCDALPRRRREEKKPLVRLLAM